jgi:uncharacterized membrane protein YccF (DUF307 family)
MNAAVARAERHKTVRDAARGWQRAHLIDDATLASIERVYPDDRRRLGPVFRSLAFLFTVFAVGSAFASVDFALWPYGAHAMGVLALLFGVALWATTEGLKGPLRVADAGIESALALAGAVFMAGGGAHWVYETLRIQEPAGVRFVALSAMVLCALTALRWGSTVGALAATCCLGVLLAAFPLARLSWVMAALVLAPLALRGSESARLAPSHRRVCAAVLAISLVGVYVALHIGSWDGQLLERGGFVLGLGQGSAPLAPPRALFKWTTALVPLLLLAGAIMTRRRLILSLGLLLGVASLITLRFYVHVAPLWVILTAVGAGLIGLALGLRRWLESGPAHERRGWTARPLSGEGAHSRALEAAVAVIAATPQAATPETPRFEGGGGRSGGAGASAEF